MSCGLGRRHGLDPALLWLWWRLASIALIRPLAWEPPYTTGVVLKRLKKKKQTNKKQGDIGEWSIMVRDFDHRFKVRQKFQRGQ